MRLGDRRQRNLRSSNGCIRNLCFCDGAFGDTGSGDGCLCDLRRRNGGIRNLRVSDLRVADMRRLNGCIGNQSRCDGCGLNMGRLDGRHADLQRADRAVLQLPAAHRVDGQLGAGDDAVCQLAGRDHIALDGVGDGTQRHGSVLAGKAIIGVLRHAHGHLHADAAGDYPNAVAEKDILQKAMGIGSSTPAK